VRHLHCIFKYNVKYKVDNCSQNTANFIYLLDGIANNYRHSTIANVPPYYDISTYTMQSTDATHIPHKSWFDIPITLPSLA